MIRFIQVLKKQKPKQDRKQKTMSEKAPTNTATVEMVPAFGVPNKFQVINAKENLYSKHVENTAALPEVRGTEAIFSGAMNALGLHGKETPGLLSAEGASRSVKIDGLSMNINPVHSAGALEVDAEISDKFIFALVNPKDPSSELKKVRVTSIVLRPEQGQDTPANGDSQNFIPLRGVKRPDSKFVNSKYEPSRLEYTDRGYDVSEQASQVEVILYDGKPASVSWITPDTQRRGPNGVEPVSGRTHVSMTDMPTLRENEARNYGHGEALLVDGLLAATSKMFEAQSVSDEAEKARRIKAASDLAQVVLNSEVSNAAFVESMTSRPITPEVTTDPPF